MKLRAGLFEKGKPSSRPLANKRELLGAAEHRAVARQAVRESLVLLKNENGVLPLRAQANVLVAGDGADNIGKQSGGWTITWQGTDNTNSDFPGATSIFAGIKLSVENGGGTRYVECRRRFNAATRRGHRRVRREAVCRVLRQRQIDRLSGRWAERIVALLHEAQSSRASRSCQSFCSGRPLWVIRS